MRYLKMYKVTFVVQAPDLQTAVQQAEGYLNTGTRCVDCNVEGPYLRRGARTPHPAPPLFGIEVEVKA